jgi:hypothetical protein
MVTMAMNVAAGKSRDKRTKTRKRIWPDSDALIFSPNEAKGFARVPRVVPLVARLVNELGAPINAGQLYQVLWAHDWGDGVVEIKNFRTLLFEAGYTERTSRTERTWRERISLLRDHGLVQVARNGLDEFGFVLLIDPYLAVTTMRKRLMTNRAYQTWLDQFDHFCETWGVDLEGYEEKVSSLAAAAKKDESA